ncbi:hypothetical protein DFR55_12013 [Herbinix hemicellulosilytica]|uniref:Uncharacterized protein n=1 Tax=Herbinix hemicellulosilytica TaxID=1564487 RepID=A0A0H5SFE0_HERHM|nr:hypothetical protein [Herbinix hemicellulosilytica]RBP57671.1 hypothetical protein DFR55_12013 [Herbinix hemicellulosilytica]CRZ34154.1 hypothetical protein HHT355_0951 [Herbinix hemicellulosilytica]
MSYIDRWSYQINRFVSDKETLFLTDTYCNRKLHQKSYKLIHAKRKHKLKAVGLKV